MWCLKVKSLESALTFEVTISQMLDSQFMFVICAIPFPFIWLLTIQDKTNQSEWTDKLTLPPLWQLYRASVNRRYKKDYTLFTNNYGGGEKYHRKLSGSVQEQ